MNVDILEKYLRNLKFVVIADAQTRKPFDIFFGFDLPNMHSDIFEAAQIQYEHQKMKICVQGGGKISKKDNYIVFHGTSQKYKRYEDDVVLSLAKKNAIFKDSGFVFLSKAGEDNILKIIERYEK
jgi:hypothetical protein